MSRAWPQPTTWAGRILAELADLPDGLTDAALAHRLGGSHQTINAACRRLAMRGCITRTHGDGRLINRLRSSQDRPDAPLAATASDAPPWFWEGNVQARIVDFLVDAGWEIVRQANAASHEPGKDIEAERGEARLWVTVKGYPVATPKTPARLQAGHWFAAAIFDVIRWRQESPNARLVAALPDFPRYRDLAGSVRWLERAAPFSYLWVAQSKAVVGASDVAAPSNLESEAR